MSEAITQTPTQPTTQTPNQSGAPSDAGVTTSSESQKTLPSSTSTTSTPVQEPTKARIAEVHNDQASSTFNSFASDGSGKEKFNFDSIIPDEHKEKEWVKNISKSEDPLPELFKKVDNLESLLGKKQQIQVPGPDATPEQRKAFSTALGVPESIKGYEVKPIEWAPEDKPIADSLKQYKPDDFVNPLKERAMEKGVSKEAWEAIEQEWDKQTVKQLKAQQAAGKQLDVDFDTQMTKMYGDQKMAVMDRGSKLLAQFAPIELKGVLAKAPNDLLAAFAGTLSNIYKATTREDTFNTGMGNTTTTASTGATTRQELFKLADKLSKMNPMTPEYESLAKKVQAGYNSLPAEVLAKPLSMM
jgi:hypothetical protein